MIFWLVFFGSIVLVILALICAWLTYPSVSSSIVIFINGMCCGAWVYIIRDKIMLNKMDKWIIKENNKFEFFMDNLLEQNKTNIINDNIRTNNVIDLTEIHNHQYNENDVIK